MKLNSNMFNVKPSPYDYRDYPLGTFISKDQGAIPDFKTMDIVSRSQMTDNCTNAGQAMLLGAYFGEVLSMIYSYGNVNPGEYNGPGETVREALKDVYRDGLCLDSSFPEFDAPREEIIKAFWELPDEVREEAKKFRWGKYYRLSKEPEHFLRVMRKLGVPFVAAIPIYRDVWQKALSTDGVVEAPAEGDVNIGGHFVIFNGKEGDYISLPNSWGPDKPVNGVQKLHMDYPIWEVWLPIPHFDTEVVMTMGEKEYTINGVKHVMDTEPAVVNGRIMVPLRFLMNAIGFSFVDWVADESYALVQYGGHTLYFYLGKDYFVDGYNASMHKYDHGVTNMANKDNRMLVPVRRVFEYLGWTVEWDGLTKQVKLTNHRED